MRPNLAPERGTAICTMTTPIPAIADDNESESSIYMVTFALIR